MAHLSSFEIKKMQVKRIEKEIRDTPYHKATEHHIGKLRARLSRLKESLEEGASKHGGGGGGYAVKKQGDATIVLAGPPSVGKSTLLNKLTNAQSKVAPYAFTTVSVIPGMMVYKDARIQILDVPGLIKGAEEGKGRGREVLSVIRGTDLLIIMTDTTDLGAFARIEKTLAANGVRINKTPPEVIVEKQPAGGLIIHSNIRQLISSALIKEIAQEFGIKNAEITLKENLTLDRLIDAFSLNRSYISTIFVINKVDLGTTSINESIHRYTPILISADKGIGLEELQENIWERLNLTRVYLVHPDEEPKFDEPIIMKKSQTLYDVASKIGSEFAGDKKSAKIWGAGAKFPGQEVSLTTKVQEGMQVRFV